ncbi:SdpI family protein [Microbacterium nymphoidis]|uniref:SdpI family protein n=1 Tax=Microbacterium nymphoidis TaxID=2898586 RepID=UPI001E5557DC|nr:SdpI family protein [Microbacterium nymphoidis]MCD2498464.1 SdpI family protein [Microbacterium nymphoidis]
MNPVDLIGPAIAILAGLLILWWGIACLTARFPRNLVLGYRTRAALTSKAAWDAAHRGYAPFLIGGGLLLALSGAIAIILVLADATELVGPAITVGIIALLAGLIIGGILAHGALRRHLTQTE